MTKRWRWWSVAAGSYASAAVLLAAAFETWDSEQAGMLVGAFDFVVMGGAIHLSLWAVKNLLT